VLPWTVPTSSNGKATDFAEDLSADAVADVRPTMGLHFRELQAGSGPAGALEDPTYGFGCWTGAFTRLRERLHGAAAAPASRSPGRSTSGGATPEAKAAVAAMTANYVGRTGG
jgi:hypothetical protein